MKNNLATLCLLFAGAFLFLGLHPATVHSTPGDVEEEIPTGHVCGIVKNAKATETDAVELSVEILVSDNMGMPISTKAVGTFYGSANDESCSYHLRPNAFMCFDFSERSEALWISNCVASN